MRLLLNEKKMKRTGKPKSEISSKTKDLTLTSVRKNNFQVKSKVTRHLSQTSKPSEACKNELKRVINLQILFDKLDKWSPSISDLFVDEKFPVTPENLSKDFRACDSVDWLRPGDILASKDDHARLGVYQTKWSEPTQKQLGDCYLVTACQALCSTAQGRRMLQAVFPDEASERLLDGLVKCRFYVNGCVNNASITFIDVVIDDRLPVDKRTNKLIYGSCENATDFWFPLLEKAYAKLYGSNYENIVAGVPEEVFIDICGALTLYLNPQNSHDSQILIEKLCSMRKSDRLIACADTVRMKSNSNSVPKSHSFTIVDFISATNNEYMIKLKNPWSSKQPICQDMQALNRAKTEADNILLLSFADFQIHFGAASLLLKLPCSSNDIVHEFTGEFATGKMYSDREILEKQLTCKNDYLNYLTTKTDFYLLESSGPCEILFNFTQYEHLKNFQSGQHNELKLCIVDLAEDNRTSVFNANYSHRIESSRTGRTLSKLFKIPQAKQQYLVCCMIVNKNVRTREDSLQSRINYLLRACCLNETANHMISFVKIQNLSDANIHFDVNSCSDCNRIMMKGLTDPKFFCVNNFYYCTDCYGKKKFTNATGSLSGLLSEYVNLV